MNIRIYRLRDSHGTTVEVVCEDALDRVFICGLKDRSGEYVSFESEAYHMGSWLDKLGENGGISREIHEITLDLDNLKLGSWTVKKENAE